MSETDQAVKLAWYDYAIACWPLLLITVGGLLGGALGGAACAMNLKILKSNIPIVTRYLITPIVGFAAVGLYIFGALALRSAIGS